MGIYNKMKRIFKPYDADVLEDFVIGKLKSIEAGKKILDLGCGSQKYKKYCSHLEYYSQDIGDSSCGTGDDKKVYNYGKLDYVGNCWDVDEVDETFDIILCTEVFEHIPYPEETIKEVSRLLKQGGKFIVTFPLFSLRHMNPYWFSPGYSDNWVNYFMDKYKFKIVSFEKYGDYSMFLRSELLRTAAANKIHFLWILPSLIYYRFIYKGKKNHIKNLMYLGNHIEVVKIIE